MITEDYEDYLSRLGVDVSGAPSTGTLFALQRAHLERVPYENVGIQLGRPPGIEPEVSVRRIAAGHGGYCFHLNGAFAALLEALGYEVTRHTGGVHESPEGRGADGNHLALTVRADGESWFVDTGLGDGPHEPLPLRPGTYRQGPFTYRMEPSATEPGGWVFHHDPGGSFAVMEFSPRPAAMADFAGEHLRLSTAPDSPFLTTFAVLRRDAEGVDALRGRVLTRVDAAGRATKPLDTPGEWFGVLADVFGLDPDALGTADRSLLWDRVSRAHEAWSAARQVPEQRTPPAAADADRPSRGETEGWGTTRRGG